MNPTDFSDLGMLADEEQDFSSEPNVGTDENNPLYLGNVLDGVCKLILEELAFLFCDSQDASTFDYGQIVDAHAAYLNFTGPKNGKIEIAAGQNLCLLLSSNMLGIEPEDEDASAYADDALKEALNVITGRFLTEAYGEEAVFVLNAPEIGNIGDLAKVDENAKAESMQFFETEGYCLVVKLTIFKK
ncbi:MAG: chemotaxis protein CheX [Chitinispirillales bacterium]|jgi:CheY-specific phosphatase CheX|nr:chemotaxis protein CheX [Chitinispirillales bacterium]